MHESGKLCTCVECLAPKPYRQWYSIECDMMLLTNMFSWISQHMLVSETGL